MAKRQSIGMKINVFFLAVAGFATLYPFLYIFSVSISSQLAIRQRKVFLWPVGFDLTTYAHVFNDPRIITGFMNSIFYTLLGTMISVLFTMITAYPLADESFQKYGKFFMRMIIFTMLFSGGIIPNYILLKEIGFLNKIWAIIIPGAINVFNLILAQTFIKQLPKELNEAAVIDGAGEVGIFSKIILPLCKPIIACITLYYAVGIWNAYFAPLLYLSSPRKFPLQLYLQEIVLQAQNAERQLGQTSGTKESRFVSEAVKCCTLVISIVPILMVYPFLQKYFVKGIMIGAVKG